MKIQIENETYIDIDEVMKILRRSKSSIYYDVKLGKLPKSLELKNVRFWKLKDVDSVVYDVRVISFR